MEAVLSAIDIILATVIIFGICGIFYIILDIRRRDNGYIQAARWEHHEEHEEIKRLAKK
jgi:hypothetical protein